MSIISGNITGTGPTQEVSGSQLAIDISMTAGTVSVEWCVDGVNWRKIEDFTESTQRVYDAPNVPVRLNCTTYSAPVAWSIRTR